VGTGPAEGAKRKKKGPASERPIPRRTPWYYFLLRGFFAGAADP
jgi:hypothetical protein